MKEKRNVELSVLIIPIGIGINLGIGAIVSLLKLPIYFDAIGTIFLTLLLGLRIGIITGSLSFLIGGILVNPVMPYFILTQVAIALYTFYIAKVGGFRNHILIIVSGIGLGIVAAIVSAPVIAYFFGGVTGSGASFIVAYMLATGKSLLNSIVLGGLSIEPIDKTLQTIIAISLLKSLPMKIKERFNSELLTKNKII